MTTIVLENRFLFGRDPDGEMHMSFVSLEAPDGLDGIGGMYHPGEEAEPGEMGPQDRETDHHHHRPHEREYQHKTLPDHHHHRPFDRSAGHHNRPFDTHGPATRSVRNRNPGNIKYGPFAKSHGATGQDSGGFAIFPSNEAGEKAQLALWNTPAYANAPLGHAGARWSAGGYHALAGVSSSTRWRDLTPDQQQRLLDAQREREGWHGGGGATPEHHGAHGAYGLTPERHGRYQGKLTVDGETYDFVSGGRGAGSSPPGDRAITGYLPGHLGGGEGRFATSDVYDPQAGRTRSLVRIHASSSSDIDSAVSSGCFGVPQSQWPRLKKELNSELAAHGGRMVLHVGEDGNAQIYPVGGTARGKSFSPHKGGSRNLADVAETMAGLRDRDPEGHRKISEYLRTGGAGMDPATNLWCASFLAATARHAGLRTPKNANVATAWEGYGTPVRPEDVRRGDVMIGGTTGRRPGEIGGHVAIVAGPMRGTKIPIVEGDQRTDLASYATSPGSVHSTVTTGPAYTGGHQVGKNEVDIKDEGLVFRRPPEK